MIQTILYDPGTGKKQIGGIEQIDAWKTQSNAQIWVDLDHPTDAEDQQIAELFKFNSLEMTDATRLRHPPKIEYFEDHYLLILRCIELSENNQEPSFFQLSLFVADRYLVTRRVHSLDSVNEVWDSIAKEEDTFSHGISHIAYRITRKVANQYINYLIKFEDRLEELENALLTNLNDQHLSELTSYNSILKKIHRVMNYQKSSFHSLMQQVSKPYIQANNHEYNDLYEQMERGASLSLLHQQLSIDLVNSYISITSHRVNKIVKTLTVFTVLFVPLSFIAGLYGMNFEFMPELKLKYGYFYVLGAMTTVFLILIAYLRKLK